MKLITILEFVIVGLFFMSYLKVLITYGTFFERIITLGIAVILLQIAFIRSDINRILLNKEKVK